MDSKINLVNRLLDRIHTIMPQVFFALFVALAFIPLGTAETTTVKQLQLLKLEMVQLNKQMKQLTEQRSNPAEHLLSLYLSLEVIDIFDLYNIKIVIDDKLVLSKNYSDKEINALKQGGVQKLYLKNMVKAEHQISALISGVDKQGKSYKHETTGHFDNRLFSR